MLSLWWPPSSIYRPLCASRRPSLYLLISLHLLPCSPRISCHLGFVYEPLPWKDRLIEDLAQLRSAWFPFPPNKMFHLVPYCLHAGGKVFPISTESNMLVYVSFLAIVALKHKKQPNGVNCTKLISDNQRPLNCTGFLQVFNKKEIPVVCNNFIGEMAPLPYKDDLGFSHNILLVLTVNVNKNNKVQVCVFF